VSKVLNPHPRQGRIEAGPKASLGSSMSSVVVLYSTLMDRFAANTLRTLGIIAVAICVILASGVLLLLGLCFASLSKMGTGHSNPGEDLFVGGFFLAAVGVVVGGIFAIAYLARGYQRDPDRPANGRPLRLMPTSTEISEQFKELLPTRPQTREIDVATHLSPASSTAIQYLAIAIAAKVTSEVLLGIVGWYGSLGVRNAPFPVYRLGFMAWGLAAIAPHLVLLYALARRPSRTALSYALIIPSVHILFGLFGHSAFLAFILRAGQVAAPLLTIIPWILDILILYLAWKAIRLSGLLPDPVRLIVAAVVIFLYTVSLPLLVLLLNYLNR
jgi:hypothetical protein